MNKSRNEGAGRGSFVLALQTNVLLLSPTFISKGDKNLIYYVLFCKEIKERKSSGNLIA
jgi:hypothetical protein